MRRRFRIIIDGRIYEVEVEPLKTPLIGRKSPRVRLIRDLTRPITRDEILSPIAGTVVEVRVNTGDMVKKGDVIVILESMKTLVEIRADRSGIVKDIMVKEGQFVNKDQPIAVIKS